MRVRTVRGTLQAVRDMGLTAGWANGEFRIDYRRDDPRWTGGDEGSSYFTNDPVDAYRTAVWMAEDRRKIGAVVSVAEDARFSRVRRVSGPLRLTFADEGGNE